MAGRRTNLALLILLVLAFATGGLAYAMGTGWARWPIVAHGIVAFAIVVLTPWKSVVARRGLKRHRTGRGGSLALTFFTLVALLFGILHSTGIARSFDLVTAMQVHVGAALLTLPFAFWHVVARRVRIHHTDVSRRQLLRSGYLLGGAALVYGAVESVVHLVSLPGRDRRLTGSYEEGSFAPDDMPVTQWFNDVVPGIDPAAWRLAVASFDDMREWTYDELAAFDDRVRATIDCTGGWYAHQDWHGARLSRLIGDTGDARSVVVRSVSGYARTFSVDVIDDLLVATGVGDRPLSSGHGFPARLVAPGRRGFWWVKWIDRIELSARPPWLQLPFPLS